MPRKYSDGDILSRGDGIVWLRGHLDDETAHAEAESWLGPDMGDVFIERKHGRLLWNDLADERMWFEYPPGRGAIPVTEVRLPYA